jgi:hypothetical protein
MRTTATLALSATVAACGGRVTDPAIVAARLAHPAATFSQLQAISAVTNTPLFESFTVLAPRFTPASAAPSVALTVLSLELATRYAPWHHVRVPPLRMAERGSGGEAAATLGRTFVWDATNSGYVVSADSGAPAGGERFVLYAISQRTGLPSMPLVTMGYVDLTDRGTADSSVLGVTLVGTRDAAPLTTYASYDVTGPGTTLAGFVTDGVTRLNLRADVTTTPGTLGARIALDVAGQDVRVSEIVSVAAQSGDTARMRTDLTLASGGETVRATSDVTIDTTTRVGAGHMTVSVNDCAFATLTLGGPDLVFAAPPGVTLTAADQTTLRALFSTSFELFGTVRILLEPGARTRPPSPLSTSWRGGQGVRTE